MLVFSYKNVFNLIKYFILLFSLLFFIKKRINYKWKVTQKEVLLLSITYC